MEAGCSKSGSNVVAVATFMPSLLRGMSTGRTQTESSNGAVGMVSRLVTHQNAGIRRVSVGNRRGSIVGNYVDIKIRQPRSPLNLLQLVTLYCRLVFPESSTAEAPSEPPTRPLVHQGRRSTPRQLDSPQTTYKLLLYKCLPEIHCRDVRLLTA